MELQLTSAVGRRKRLPLTLAAEFRYVGRTDAEPPTMVDDASHPAQRQLAPRSPWDEPRPRTMPPPSAGRRTSLIDNAVRPFSRGTSFLRALAPGLVVIPLVACAGSTRSASPSSGWWCFARDDGISSCEPERSTCEAGSTRGSSVIEDGSCRWHAHVNCTRIAVTSPAQIGEHEHCSPTMAECELVVARTLNNPDEGAIVVRGCVER